MPLLVSARRKSPRLTRASGRSPRGPLHPSHRVGQQPVDGEPSPFAHSSGVSKRPRSPPRLPVAGSPSAVTRSRPPREFGSRGTRSPALIPSPRPQSPCSGGTNLGLPRPQLAIPPLPAPGNNFRGYAPPPPACLRLAAEKLPGRSAGCRRPCRFVPLRGAAAAVWCG